jgi:hypothetical protein
MMIQQAFFRALYLQGLLVQATFFAVRKTGPKRGAIFYTDHETLAVEAPFASDFDEFVSRIISDPVKLLAKDLGCLSGRTRELPTGITGDLAIFCKNGQKM